MLCASAAHAQVVRGVVRNAGARTAIRAATVEVRLERDTLPLRTSTDSLGEFSIALRRAGRFTIQARQIGFLVAEPAVFQVSAKDTLSLEMQLDSRAVPLQPVTVRAKNTSLLADFERHRAGAFGRFITREDVDAQNAQETSGLFRTMPGFVVQRSRRGGSSALLMRGTAGLCQPAVWIDNTFVPLSEQVTLDQMLTPPMIEGVEIYNSVAAAPSQYRIGTCGVLVFWTRRGNDEGGRPFRWKQVLIGSVVGVGLLLFLLGR